MRNKVFENGKILFFVFSKYNILYFEKTSAEEKGGIKSPQRK